MAKSAIPDAKRLNGFAVDPDVPIIIGLDTDHGPEHPLYDERINLPLDEAIVRNIMVYGVQETVLLQKDGDDLLVINGRQRIRAAREANARLAKEGKEQLSVPVMLRKGDDAFLFGVMVSTNELRQNDDIVTKAHKLQRLLAMHKSEEECAIAFGVQPQTIRVWRRLLDLSPKVLDLVRDGVLSATNAAKLTTLSREKQLEAAKDLAASGARDHGSVSKAVKRQKAGASADEGATKAPSKRLITKVLRANKEADVLTADFLAGVSWVLGELAPSRVAGLTKLIREAEGEAE